MEVKQLQTYDDEGNEWIISINDIVHDDLTGKKATVIKLEKSEDTPGGIWLDNDYLGGGRHPWEITKIDG